MKFRNGRKFIYLVTTVLGCVDLQTSARQYLANAVNRRLGRMDRLVPIRPLLPFGSLDD